MLLKWDQNRAWRAVKTAAPVILGPSWKAVVEAETPIDFDSIARWEAGVVNPGPNRMIPRLETIGNLMHAKAKAFAHALTGAEQLVAAWEAELSADMRTRKIESDDGFRVLEILAVAMFGSQWQRPLALHLATHYRCSISHSSFSVWKRDDGTQERLIDVLQKLVPDMAERRTSMQQSLRTYEANLARLKTNFPPKKTAVLTRKPSAVIAHLPQANLQVALAA